MAPSASRPRGRPTVPTLRLPLPPATSSPSSDVYLVHGIPIGISLLTMQQQRGNLSDRTDSSGDQADEVKNMGIEDSEESEVDDSDIESSFEIDAAYEISDEQLLGNDSDQCTQQEAVKYRESLRSLGPERFIQRTIEAGVITAKKLITAFGLKVPSELEGYPDGAYYSLLGLGISRELQKRAKLPHYNSIDDVIELLKSKRSIIVLTGAGISTSLGIPDFRSKGGLYDSLDDEIKAEVDDPQDVFHLGTFIDRPQIFFAAAKKILPEDTIRTTPTHKFIQLLQSKGKLLTNYTQNIDNIEAAAGILPEKLIQCHGSFATATCMKCGRKVPGHTIFGDIKAGTIPQCAPCLAEHDATLRLAPPKRKRSRNGHSKSRKRSRNGYGDDSDTDTDDNTEELTRSRIGIMKPDITFFGEDLPSAFSDRLTNHDKNKVDLVIVIGTSLKVAPVSEVVPYLHAHIPQIFISRDPVSHVNFDVDLLGDCDVVVAELCRRAGWELDHPMIPEEQEVEVKLAEGYRSRHVFKQVEPKK